LQVVPSLPWQLPIVQAPAGRVAAQAQLDTGIFQHRADPVEVPPAQLPVVGAEHALVAQRLHPLLPRPAEPAQQLGEGLVDAGLELPAPAGEAGQLGDPALGEVPVERRLASAP
jgi:hypothetical protein